jgi:hypothetical protein
VDVYVCVNMCLHVCMYMCLKGSYQYVRKVLFVGVNVCVNMCYVHACVCVCIYIHVCMFVRHTPGLLSSMCARVSFYECKNMCKYVHMYVCICVCPHFQDHP